MKEDSGDIWAYSAEYHVITTNGVVKGDGQLVMGAGVALQAKKMYSQLPITLGGLVRESGNIPFLLTDHKLITLPTKNHWRDPSDIDLIVSGCHAMVALVNSFGIKSVAMPRPGCGYGKLNWNDVKAAIEHVLDDRFTVLNGQ